MPTGYTPVYQIKKGDIDITGHFQDRCLQIRVDFAGGDGQGDTATFTLDDRDWLIARPNPGERLKLWLGYAEVGMNYMGTFEFDEVIFALGASEPKTISLKCSAAGQRSLLKSPTTQNYTGKTLGEIFTDLAKASGLTAKVHPDIAGKTVEALNVTTSPQQMIFELERNYGAMVKVTDGQLVAVPRDAGVSASGQTLPIVILGPEHFAHLEVRHSQRPAYTSVKAAYVDPQDHVTKFVDEKLPGSESFDGVALPWVHERKFASKAQAEAAAKSQAAYLQQAQAEADAILVTGDPWIRDQQRVLIRKTRDGVDGSFVTDLVTHTYRKGEGIVTAMKLNTDMNGADYEAQFAQADTPAKQAALFLQPSVGGLVGSLFNLGGVPAAAATAADIINGVNPFAGL